MEIGDVNTHATLQLCQHAAQLSILHMHCMHITCSTATYASVSIILLISQHLRKNNA